MTGYHRIMAPIIDRIRNEPVLVCTIIGALIYLLTTFGVNVTADQQKAIMGLAVAVLALVARAKVSPSN